MLNITRKRMYHSVFIMVWGVVTGFAQVTTIVNYDFNSGSSFGTLAPSLAPGITSAAGSTESFLLNDGTVTGEGAYTANTTPGQALAMENSSGTNTRYFTFQLGGANLALYHTYRVYFQALRASTGASTITLAYSTDGVSYTNFSTTQASGLGSYSQCSYDLSAISSINMKSTIYFKLMLSGAASPGRLSIDNLLISAIKCVPVLTVVAGAVPTTSLLAYWPFDGNANDLSGNNNNGVVKSASLTADRFGNPNKAYSFNGTTSRIDVPHSPTIDMTSGNDYTMAFWLKTNPGNVFTLPLSKGPAGSVSGYHFFVNNTNTGYCNGTGKFAYYVAADNNGDACANDLISTDAANWYFITGQYKSSSNQTFLYVNGVLQSDIGSASGFLSSISQLSFGACGCGAEQFYNGYLDDIRFYKRLLTQAEINMLYAEPNPIISCASPSITLTGSSPMSGLTYSWSPGGATTASLVVSAAGTYTLKATDPSSGCSSTSSILVAEMPCQPYYFVLKKTLDGGYYNSYKNKIYFAFEEEYYDSSQGSANSLSYAIVTEKNVPVSSAPGLIEQIGDNRYSIDLSTIGGAMAPGGFYRIAITNKKNEVFYADFKY